MVNVRVIRVRFTKIYKDKDFIMTEQDKDKDKDLRQGLIKTRIYSV